MSSFKLIPIDANTSKDELGRFYKEKLRDEAYFNEFARRGGFETVFEKLFISKNTPELARSFTAVINNNVPIDYFATIKYPNLFSTFNSYIQNEQISESMASPTIHFISSLFALVSKNIRQLTSYFMQNCITYFNTLTDKIPEETRGFCYSRLLESYNDDLSPPPNISIYKYVSFLFDSNMNMRASIFEIVLDAILKIPNSAKRFNQEVPLRTFFNSSKTPMSELVALLGALNDKSPEIVPDCLPSILRSLLSSPCETNFLVKLVHIIQDQLDRGNIDTNFLFEANFLSAFFIDKPSENLVALFTKCPSFLQISIDIFSLQGAISFRASVFKSITTSAELFPNSTQFVGVCTAFFVANPTETNIKLLIETTERTKDTSLLRALRVVFVNNPESQKSFQNIGGIKWIFDQFKKGNIPVDTFADVIAALVSSQSFPEVDSFIDKLPPDSPLFKAPKIVIDKIVYGQSTAQYRIIRVKALLHLLDPVDYLDPYNAYVLGSQYLEMWMKKSGKIFECPMIKFIANRFIPPEYINHFFERPADLEVFCNSKLDHFPIFQFFPDTKNPLTVNVSSVGVSFWVRFVSHNTARVPFFKNDAVKIENIGSTLIITFDDSESSEIEIIPTKWNFVMVSLSSSIRGTEITVNINNDTAKASLKQKRTTFTQASFISEGNALMYIGSAIRFYKNKVSFKTAFGRGAGFTDCLPERPEERIVTPTLLLSTKEKLATIPSNCYLVPYFGLPMHFVSMDKTRRLLCAMEAAENEKDFAAIQRTLLKIHSITNSKSPNFWPMLLYSMVKKRNFMNKALFKRAISSISLRQDAEKLLTSIIYNSELWISSEHFTTEDIVSTLFECFTKFQLHSIDNFELFLAHIILHCPQPGDVIRLFIMNIRQLPILSKYLVGMLKVAPQLRAPVITWDSLEFREENIIQEQVLVSLIGYANTDTVDDIMQMLPYDDLKALMVVSTREFAHDLFLLMAAITKLCPSYLVCDGTIETQIASIASYPDVWKRIREMIAIGADSKADFLPLEMILVWSGSICMVHTHSFNIPKTEHIIEIEDMVGKSIEYLSQHIPQILSNQESVDILCGWYPLILHHSRLFKSFFDGETITADPMTENINMQAMPEVKEKIWIGTEQVITELLPPPQRRPAFPSQFMLELVGTVLEKNCFQMPFPNDPEDQESVDKWFAGSKVIMFLTDIILSAPQPLFNSIFESIFFTFAMMTEQRLDPFIPTLVHSLLSRIPVCYSPTIPFKDLFLKLHALAGLQFLSDNSLLFLSDIFTACTVLVSKLGENGLRAYAGVIHPIVLFLFQALNVDSYDLAFSLLNQNAQLFSILVQSQNALYAWLMAFLLPSRRTDKFDTFIKRFLIINKFDAKDRALISSALNRTLSKDMNALILLENDWKKFSSEFQFTFQQLSGELRSMKVAFPIITGQLSKDTHKIKMITWARHFVLSNLFSHSLRFLQSSSQLLEEKRVWSTLIKRMFDNAANIENFNPLNYLFDTAALPYCSPHVLIPSPYPQLTDNSHSIPLKIHKENMKFMNNSARDLRMNMLDLFIKMHQRKYGEPSALIQCQLLRYARPLHSVMVCFDRAIMFVTNACLSEDGDDIELLPTTDVKAMHIFMEGVFTGVWGTTSIFAQKVVIKVRTRDIIHLKANDAGLIFWTFYQGNFTVRMERDKLAEIKSRVKRINESAAKSMPPVSLAHLPHLASKLSEIESKWHNGLLSTYQFLLYLNGKNGRTFSDLAKMPIIPNPSMFLTFSKLPDAKSSSQILSNLNPISYYCTDSASDINCEVPACIVTIPEAIKEIPNNARDPLHATFMVRTRLEEAQHTHEFTQWISAAFKTSVQPAHPAKRNRPIGDPTLIHFAQLLNVQFTDGVFQYDTNSKFIQLPPLSSMVNSIPGAVIVLEPSSATLSIIDTKTREKYLSVTSVLFTYAVRLVSSDNDLFIAIDFSYGATQVLRIVYQNGVPTSITQMSGFSWSGEPLSVISGVDWVYVSAVHSNIVIWRITTATIIRSIDIFENVIALALDEAMGCIWAATNTRLIYLTLNGIIVAQTAVTLHVTVIKVCPNPEEKEVRTAIVGTSSGTVVFASPSLHSGVIEVKEMSSPHKSGIKKIVLHPSRLSALSVDVNGIASNWTGFNCSSPKLKASLVQRCLFCPSGATTHCARCSRAVCDRCMGGQSICLYCIALTSYL